MNVEQFHRAFSKWRFLLRLTDRKNNLNVFFILMIAGIISAVLDLSGLGETQLSVVGALGRNSMAAPKLPAALAGRLNQSQHPATVPC